MIMTMKKIFNYALAAALVGSLSLGVTSCKSDEDVVSNEPASTVGIDTDIVSHGIVTDMCDAVVELPVDCDGRWYAILGVGQKESPDWVNIQDWAPHYEGKQTLRLAFSENRSGVDRETTLTVANNEGTPTTVKVRQTYTYKGQAPTNSSGKAFSDKGIGYGMDYDYLLDTKSIRYRNVMEQMEINAGLKKEDDRTQFNALAISGINNVFQISEIENLVKEGGLQHSAYVEAPIEVSELKAAMLDQALVQSKDVDVKLKIDLSFGPVEFNAKASYSYHRTDSKGYLDYSIIRKAPMYDVRLSPAEITEYASKPKNRRIDKEQLKNFDEMIQDEIDVMLWQNKRKKNLKVNEDGLTAAQQAIIDGLYNNADVAYGFGNVFSTNFAKQYSRLLRAITFNNEADPQLPINKATADAVCQKLNDDYGPFIICRGEFGGSIILMARVDTVRQEGKTHASGELGGGIGGVFDASGRLEYADSGFVRMRNLGFEFKILGGDANGLADALTRVVFSPSPDNRDLWFDSLSGWLDSMASTDENESRANPITYDVVPIWTLFTEPDINAYVRQWFLDKYTERGILDYLDILDGKPDAKTAEEILGQTTPNDMELEPTGIPVSGNESFPLTVAQSDSIAGLMDDARLAKSVFYTSGIICSVTTDSVAGKTTFVISDNGLKEGHTLECPELTYVEGKSWWPADVELNAGSPVVVFGKLLRGKDKKYKFATGGVALYSIGGETPKQ